VAEINVRIAVWDSPAMMPTTVRVGTAVAAAAVNINMMIFIVQMARWDRHVPGVTVAKVLSVRKAFAPMEAMGHPVTVTPIALTATV